VRIAPENPQAHNLMGMILTEAQRPAVGEYHYRRVLELSGARDPILLANLAWNLKTQGRMAEARTLNQESVAAAPDNQADAARLGRLEEAIAASTPRRCARSTGKTGAERTRRNACPAPCCSAAPANTTRR